MNELLIQLESRIALLKDALSKAESKKSAFPEGHLRVSANRNHKRNRYYHITESGDHSGRYLTKDHLDLARKLAQKDYTIQFLKQAHMELSRLERTLSQISKCNANLEYEKLPDARKILISPYIIPDDLYAREWQDKQFKSNPYMPENRVYDTRRGEKVRSKSEAILADIFYDLGIPYNYEMPLRLKSGAVRYPDFTLLKIKTREEIYLEHFGLLDDEEYRNSCLHKLDEYRNSGIYPGKNLIFTYETAEYPLDIKGIRKMIKELML